MNLKVRKIGNSYGVILPAEVLAAHAALLRDNTKRIVHKRTVHKRTVHKRTGPKKASQKSR